MKKGIKVTQHADFQIATAPGRSGGFVSWAKMGRIQGPDAIREPGNHVWFNFGATREEAVQRICDELYLPPNTQIQRRR